MDVKWEITPCLSQEPNYFNVGVVRIKSLEETIELMTNTDYKDRFKAEFEQLCFRISELDAFLNKWDKGELKTTPKSPREWFERQRQAMADYCQVLTARAIEEEIY